MLRDHFGPGGGSLAMQEVHLSGGRTALLMSRANEGDLRARFGHRFDPAFVV